MKIVTTCKMTRKDVRLILKNLTLIFCGVKELLGKVPLGRWNSLGKVKKFRPVLPWRIVVESTDNLSTTAEYETLMSKTSFLKV